MDDLDFSGKEHNESMDMLIDASLWLARQFKAAIELIPSSVVVNALQNGDAAHKFFLFAGTEHLPNLAAATSVMKTPVPPQQASNIDMILQASALGVVQGAPAAAPVIPASGGFFLEGDPASVEVEEITADDVDDGWPDVVEDDPNNP